MEDVIASQPRGNDLSHDSGSEEGAEAPPQCDEVDDDMKVGRGCHVDGCHLLMNFPACN